MSLILIVPHTDRRSEWCQTGDIQDQKLKESIQGAKVAEGGGAIPSTSQQVADCGTTLSEKEAENEKKMSCSPSFETW